MAKKSSASKKATKAKAQARTSTASPMYQVVLREPGGEKLEANVLDNVLYPKAVAWNRLLTSNRGRSDGTKEEMTWRAHARQAVLELANSGDVRSGDAVKFIEAAARSGVVQVEMEWTGDDHGYAARVFPWEELIALATKDERVRIDQPKISVVRWLRAGKPPSASSSGAPVFVVTKDAMAAGFDIETELAVVRESLRQNTNPDGGMPLRTVSSLHELAAVMQSRPKLIHFVMRSLDKAVFFCAEDAARPEEKSPSNADVAKTIAAHGPELIALSSCYTGRRLAPHAIAAGARQVIGFHGEVMDESLPTFFGALYEARRAGNGIRESLQLALDANKRQPNPSGLGAVTLWSSTDMLAAKPVTKSVAASASIVAPLSLSTRELKAALLVDCELEDALNYSVLHNSRGGLFKKFILTKVKPGELERPVEVKVRLDTGFDRPAECHYYADLPVEGYSKVDLAASVALPLGSQLLRQRGEMMLGTVEVSVHFGDACIFHCTRSVKLLPCDEWRDDSTGRHFLPSFIFPRDPAVRAILSTAQPFLRALTDRPQAGFDGYQGSFAPSAERAADLQAQAIWAALQHTYRLDYVNPPPTYMAGSQRLRTPEEILRAHRGTCIELALLLAACWEHIGLQPVVFLTSGHAFAGYWAREDARSNFITGLSGMFEHASKTNGGHKPSGKEAADGAKVKRDITEPWMLAEPFHLAAIRGEVGAGRLVPVEATFIPLQRSFEDARIESAALLKRLGQGEQFDGMLDVQTARDKGVTPLAIIHEGVVA